tara:strand:+ start:2622 stop:4106 length:1485 start_codon:yes stop_codon:yes gene_type:complete
MTEKNFGVKKLDIIGSGTPTIESPSGGDLNITAATSTFSGNVTLPDNKKLRLGNTAGDFDIYYDNDAFLTTGSRGLGIQVYNGSFTISSGASNTFKFGLTAFGFTSAVDLVPSGSKNVGTDTLKWNDAHFSGTVNANTFVGSLTGTASNATTASNITIADESADTTCFPIFATQNVSGANVSPKTNANLAFRADTGALTASSFIVKDKIFFDEHDSDGDSYIARGETTFSQSDNIGIFRDGTMRFEVNSFGVQIHDTNLKIDNDQGLFLGTSPDSTKLTRSSDMFTIENLNDSMTIRLSQANSTGLYIKNVDSTLGDRFYAKFESNNFGVERVELLYGGNKKFETTSPGVTITGNLSATGTKSFKIPHPLVGLSTTKELVHTAVEGPQVDLLYRGKTTLVAGISTINIDTKADMTEGTFVAINRDVQCFTTNETGWTPVKGSVSGNQLTIVSQDNSCTDTISWMVIGERQDDNIINNEMTDSQGYLIVEPDLES